jgi:hypothetical protein
MAMTAEYYLPSNPGAHPAAGSHPMSKVCTVIVLLQGIAVGILLILWLWCEVIDKIGEAFRFTGSYADFIWSERGKKWWSKQRGASSGGTKENADA